MKCPNCPNELGEEFEILMGEKCYSWYCPDCNLTFKLIWEGYIPKKIEELKKKFMKDIDSAVIDDENPVVSTYSINLLLERNIKELLGK